MHVDDNMLRKRILEILCEKGEITADEILAGVGDKRAARRILGELVREGLVERKPCYEKRRMVFSAKRHACETRH
jgi:predicted ArsR family transcriptional regulator